MSRKTIYAVIAGIFLAALLSVIFLILIPGRYIYVPEKAVTPTPIATPMDVTLKMRGPDGKIDQIWLCKYDRKEGWVCQLEEEPDGETLDED